MRRSIRRENVDVSDVRVSDATDDDLAALAPLLSRARPLNEPYTADALRDVRSADENAICLSAFAGDRLVGGALATGGGPWRQPDGAFMVPAFIVDEAHRGHGIGTAMAAHIETRAFASRARRVVTSIHGDAEPALRFAAKRGYREFHRESWSLLDLRKPARAQIETTVPDAGVRVITLGEVLATEPPERRSLVERISGAQQELLADLPSSEISYPQRSPDEYESSFLRSLATEASFVALRGTEVVALVLVRRGRSFATIVATGEVGSGRGRKLIVPLKIRAIEALRRAGVDSVVSIHDRDNAVTRQLNRSLGFERQSPLVRLELRRK